MFSQPVISEVNEITDQCSREAPTLREYQRSREVLTLQGGQGWIRTSLEMVSFQPVFRELNEIYRSAFQRRSENYVKTLERISSKVVIMLCIEMVSFQPVLRELNEIAEASLFQRSPYFSRKPGGLYIKNKGRTSWEEVIILGVWFAQSPTLLHELSLIQE